MEELEVTSEIIQFRGSPGQLEANKPASKDTMLKGPAHKDSDSAELGWSNIWDLIVFKLLCGKEDP